MTRLDIAKSCSWPEDEVAGNKCEDSGEDTDKRREDPPHLLLPSVGMSLLDSDAQQEGNSSSVDVNVDAEVTSTISSPQSLKRVRFALQEEGDLRVKNESNEVGWPCRGAHRSVSSPNKRAVSLSSTLKQMLQLVLDESSDVRITHHAVHQVMQRYAQAQCEIAHLRERVQELEQQVLCHPAQSFAASEVLTTAHQDSDAMAVAQSRRHSRQELREARRIQEARIIELLQSCRQPEAHVTTTNDSEDEWRVPATSFQSDPAQWTTSLVDLDVSICSSDDALSPSCTVDEDATRRVSPQKAPHDYSTFSKGAVSPRRTRLSSQLSRLRCRSQREDESDSTTICSSNDESRSNGIQEASFSGARAWQPSAGKFRPRVEQQVWGVRLHL